MESKQQWSLLTALGCLAILVAGYMFLVKPQHNTVTSLRAQTASVQQQTAQLKVKLATLQAESRNLASEQAKLAEIARQLPVGPQLPTLTRQLDHIAVVDSIDLVNLSPGQPAALSTTTTTTTSAAGTATSAGPTLMAIPVTLNVSGGFFNMERFLDSIEGLQRSMLVDGFTVAYQAPATAANTANTASAGPAPPRVGGGELMVTITARVFETTAPLSAATAAAQ